MSQAFTPGLQVKALETISRRRELPLKGEILVAAGQTVSAKDQVAHAFLPGELYLIRLAEKMGLEPSEIISGLRVKEGDAVASGSLICQHTGLFGLFKARFSSPIDGQVELINPETGHIGIRMPPRKVSLNAYIAGRVMAIEDQRTVIIESKATFVQGIFGIGGERNGEILCLREAMERSLQVSDVPENIEGKILIGGTNPSSEVLQKASKSGAAGMVVGGIDDQALAGYLGYDLGIALTGDEDVPMTVIITEGFGSLPIAKRVLDILLRNDGKKASINGATQVRAGALRPEIIIPQDLPEDNTRFSEEPSSTGAGLEAGCSIRMIRVPYFGLRGKVIRLPAETHQIETGAMTRVVEAELDDGRIVMVPRANVELA